MGADGTTSFSTLQAHALKPARLAFAAFDLLHLDGADLTGRWGNRGLWVKTKALKRQEFVILGWTDPEGSRPHLGSLLLGYDDNDGKLAYAGRAGTGMTDAELKALAAKSAPACRR